MAESKVAEEEPVAADASTTQLTETEHETSSTMDAPTSQWRRECKERKRRRALHAEQRIQVHRRVLALQNRMDAMLGPHPTYVFAPIHFIEHPNDIPPDREVVVLDMEGPMRQALQYQRRLEGWTAGATVARSPFESFLEPVGEAVPNDAGAGASLTNRKRCSRCGLVSYDIAALREHGEAIHKQADCVEEAPVAHTIAHHL